MRRLSVLVVAAFLVISSAPALALPGFQPARFEGNKTLPRTIEFGGETFSVSDNVISRLDVDMLDAELQVDMLRHDLIAASFYLGLIGKVKYVDGEVKLSSSALTERRDFQAPITMVGLAAGAGFANNLVRADARGTGKAYSGEHLDEGDVVGPFVPLPFLR